MAGVPFTRTKALLGTPTNASTATDHDERYSLIETVVKALRLVRRGQGKLVYRSPDASWCTAVTTIPLWFTTDYLEPMKCQKGVITTELLNPFLNQRHSFAAMFCSIILKTVVSVSGVHRVMVELSTATEKAVKAIAEGQAQLQKGVEKVRKS